jgi:hypothetical protein
MTNDLVKNSVFRTAVWRHRTVTAESVCHYIHSSPLRQLASLKSAWCNRNDASTAFLQPVEIRLNDCGCDSDDDQGVPVGMRAVRNGLSHEITPFSISLWYSLRSSPSNSRNTQWLSAPNSGAARQFFGGSELRRMGDLSPTISPSCG